MRGKCDHVILGTQPVIHAGPGRCFWRASTHPEPEMAKTGRTKREGAGGEGSADGRKLKNGSEQQPGAAGGASARPELPGVCCCVPLSPRKGKMLVAPAGDHCNRKGAEGI